jgi:hypothetical protein
MRVHRSISQPIRLGLDTERRWKESDQGLIAAWERGRQLSDENPDLAARARAGELIVLPWKGGVEKALKSGEKYGTLRYLAMWQGLRGDDLDIEMNTEPQWTCTRTQTTVVFTNDIKKYGGPG